MYFAVTILGWDKSDITFLAEQVMVLDPSSSPQEELLEQMLVKSSSEIDTEEGMPLPVKRATLCLERTLEDVMEDEEELLEDRGAVHEETQMTESILEEEEAPEGAISEEDENSDLVIGKEDYQVCPGSRGENVLAFSSKGQKASGLTNCCSNMKLAV